MAINLSSPPPFPISLAIFVCFPCARPLQISCGAPGGPHRISMLFAVRGLHVKSNGGAVLHLSGGRRSRSAGTQHHVCSLSGYRGGGLEEGVQPAILSCQYLYPQAGWTPGSLQNSPSVSRANNTFANTPQCHCQAQLQIGTGQPASHPQVKGLEVIKAPLVDVEASPELGLASNLANS